MIDRKNNKKGAVKKNGCKNIDLNHSFTKYVLQIYIVYNKK